MLRFKKIVFQSIALVAIVLFSNFSSSAQDGKAIFQANCASCHNPIKDATGPALQGVDKRVPSKEWLYNWVHNSAKVISSGDKYANDLYNKWNKTAMTAFPQLSNAEIDAVIKYVNDNPGSIGVVGVNWMVQPPTDLEKIVAELKILGVKNSIGKPGSDAYYKPTQNDIALGMYPLTRSLYVINCEGGTGLGTGFASFIAGERGQRVVLKSGLLPDSIPSREINIVN